jgi:hypothetical protein
MNPASATTNKVNLNPNLDLDPSRVVLMNLDCQAGAAQRQHFHLGAEEPNDGDG